MNQEPLDLQSDALSTAQGKLLSVMEIQIPWDLEEILISNRKVISPMLSSNPPFSISREWKFSSPLGDGKLLHKWWKIILANKTTKSKTNTIFFLLKDLAREGI